MAVTLIQISRRFSDTEIALVRQNRDILSDVFGEVALVLVQNNGFDWSPEIDALGAVVRTTGPKDQSSAAANRLAGSQATTDSKQAWSIYLDADMELLPDFAHYLKALPPVGPEIALCDRIDRNPKSGAEKVVQPIFRQGKFLSLYGGFAIRGINAENCITVVDDLEEQWFLRNLKLIYPSAAHHYWQEVGIIHHDAKDASVRAWRHVFQMRCIGYWQGLAQRYRDGLKIEDFLFVFRGRTASQRLKLGLAILYALPAFVWRRLRGT